MKKNLSILMTFLFIGMSLAQETANRFYYQLTYKPKKALENREKVMTVLEVAKDYSVYRDFSVSAQDSLIKAEIEAMQRSGMFKDITKSIKMPAFSHKIYKAYPSMEITYSDQITSGFSQNTIGYKETPAFKWNIMPDKMKIGEYETQKATTEYGGRKWTAWFTTDIPFPDGPYKFSGLPGLIVQLNDDKDEYHWLLGGNETVKDYSELAFTEKMAGVKGGPSAVNVVPKEKFEKTMSNYIKDPLASMRGKLTPEMMSQKLPGSELTLGEMIKNQEKIINDFYSKIDNPIEILAGK